MDILLPVGRMIGGSLYTPFGKTDNFGKPKLGPDGKQLTAFNFGVAIPKGTEQHWSQTPWGAQIKSVGDAAYPGISGTPSFAWKITDGDSQVPNKKNRRPCDQEGYRGNWVLWFTQSWSPKLVNADGSQELTEPNSIVPGYFVQVWCSVKGNAPSPTPGVYLNPLAVALSAYGERIEQVTVDTTSAGFGGQPLPAGAMATPPAQFTTPPGPINPGLGQAASQGLTQSKQGFPPIGGGANMSGPGVLPGALMSNPIAPPNPAFLAIPPVPAAPPARVMLPAAQGASYEAMIAAGWNDALLIQHGMMQG